MAIAYVGEHGGLMQTSGGVAPIVKQPPLVRQKITFTTTTQSAAFGANTRVLRIVSDTACFFRVGADPTAVTAEPEFLPANTIEYFLVQPGDKIAFVT